MKYALAIALMLLCGCGQTRTDDATDRANAAADGATRAEIRAAELEARAASSQTAADRANAAAARAQAAAQRKAALAEDERLAKVAAEETAKAAKADRDRIGWWLTVAGSLAIAGSAIVGVVAWYLGLGKIGTALTIGLSAGGAVALALGLAWQWLPIAAGVLLLIAGAWLVLRLKTAGQIIANHSDEAAHADPSRPDQIDLAKSNSAATAMKQGLTRAVAFMRGKPLADAVKKAKAQLERVPV